MLPFIVLVVSFLAFLALGRLGVAPLRSWVTSLRWALALMFLFTASAHFGSRRADLIAMVPSGFPDPALLVTLTGIAEILGAIGLLIPRVAPSAALGLATLLVAVFPANAHAAAARLAIDGQEVMALVPRALVQVIFLIAVLVAGFAPRLQHRRLARRQR